MPGAGDTAVQGDVEDLTKPPWTTEKVETNLDRGLNYRLCVRILHDALDVPDEVIAAVAGGVHPGSVRRWRSVDPGVGEPRQAQAKGIEWLRRIALVLVSSGVFLDIRGVGVWMQAGRKTLGWKAPYEILAAEGANEASFEKILAEAERFVGPGAGAAAASLTTSTGASVIAGFGPPRA